MKKKYEISGQAAGQGRRKTTYLVLLLFLFCSLSARWTPLQAQYSMGTTGLMNIPTADMQPDGTFMAGGNFMPAAILPDSWGYHSGNYFVNMTFLPFLEVAYRCTLLKVGEDHNHKWNQDRSVSLRLRPLKEGKWWPAIVVGSNDAFTSGQLNMFEDSGGNRFFSSVFAVGTKHFCWGGHQVGLTVGGHIPFRSGSLNKGVLGGLEYRPAFYPDWSLMVEYDSDAVNLGTAIRLWKHLSLHVFCYDWQAVCGGLRYEVKLY